MTIRSDPAAAAGSPANHVEHALHGAARDRARMGELLDALCQGRLWLPLPDDSGPVTDGHALTLPTVRYLDAEFIPAFTSAGRLNEVLGRPDLVDAEGAHPGQDWARSLPPIQVPHAVVPAAELARLIPTGLGIALNPGAAVSVPIYPDDVAYLASTHAEVDGSAIRVGHPPEEPTRLLSAVTVGLRRVGAAELATRAWLITDSGQGLVICVTLDDPHDRSAQQGRWPRRCRMRWTSHDRLPSGRHVSRRMRARTARTVGGHAAPAVLPAWSRALERCACPRPRVSTASRGAGLSCRRHDASPDVVSARFSQTLNPSARSCSRPSSVILSGPHGGSQTQLIRKPGTRPSSASAA